jgi:hypothetical protein
LTVRGGVSITLADPVGLYIGNIALGLANGPNGEPLQDRWQITRGVSGRGLRAEFAPPPGAPFGLADVLVKNAPLRRGGQLAELVTMVLYAQTLKLNLQEPAAQTCTSKCCIDQAATDPDNAIYDQISVDQAPPAGEKDAFPELSQRTLAGGSSTRVGPHRAEFLA